MSAVTRSPIVARRDWEKGSAGGSVGRKHDWRQSREINANFFLDSPNVCSYNLSMESGVGGVAPRAGEDIAAELIRRRQKIDQDELEFSVLAAQFAETDEYDWQGFDSPHAWLKANCHLSGGAAGDRICVGQQLAHLDQSSSAMANGEIGFAHFALIARTSAAVGERLDQTALLKQARKHTIARFHDDCYHARHAADPKGCAKEEARSVEARSLEISDGDEGTVYINGYLDKVGGAAVRTALKVRDGGCTWPGCDRPVSMTEGHHLVHWIRNGPGDLPNLTLLCYRHHWMVHEGGWQIVRTDDGRVLTIPPLTGFERLPRGPD